jgi:hypothetical protein
MSELTIWLVLLGIVLPVAPAHVLLKVGIDQVGMIGFEQVRDPWDVITSVITTPALLLAGPLYGASFIGWAVVLSRFELSIAYPALATLIAQSYSHTYDLKVAIARCGNIFGGGDLNWNRLVPGTIRSVLDGIAPVIRSYGSFQRD